MERPRLPRDLKNNLSIPALACALVLIALAGAVDSNRRAIPVFIVYLVVLNTLMLVFLFRIRLLRAIDKLLIAARCLPWSYQVRVSKWIETSQQLPSVVYFSKTSNICRLNKAIQYVCQNEDASRCRIVHVYEMEEDIPRKFVRYCQLLDAIYPCIRVDVVFVRGVFGSALVQRLSDEWDVAPNLMFITCPTSESVGKRIQDLGGVRVIMGHEDEDLLTPTCVPQLDVAAQISLKSWEIQDQSQASLKTTWPPSACSHLIAANFCGQRPTLVFGQMRRVIDWSNDQ